MRMSRDGTWESKTRKAWQLHAVVVVTHTTSKRRTVPFSANVKKELAEFAFGLECVKYISPIVKNSPGAGFECEAWGDNALRFKVTATCILEWGPCEAPESESEDTPPEDQ